MLLPSPLVEGGEAERSETEPGEGAPSYAHTHTPHPPSLRSGTLSHKGRGKKHLILHPNQIKPVRRGDGAAGRAIAGIERAAHIMCVPAPMTDPHQ